MRRSEDERSRKALFGFFIARPLIVVAIGAVVVVGALLLGTHRQKTPGGGTAASPRT